MQQRWRPSDWCRACRAAGEVPYRAAWIVHKLSHPQWDYRKLEDIRTLAAVEQVQLWWCWGWNVGWVHAEVAKLWPFRHWLSQHFRPSITNFALAQPQTLDLCCLHCQAQSSNAIIANGALVQIDSLYQQEENTLFQNVSENVSFLSKNFLKQTRHIVLSQSNLDSLGSPKSLFKKHLKNIFLTLSNQPPNQAKQPSSEDNLRSSKKPLGTNLAKLRVWYLDVFGHQSQRVFPTFRVFFAIQFHPKIEFVVLLLFHKPGLPGN